MALKFDLTSIPLKSNIESAVLEIYKFHNYIGHVGKCKDYAVFRITKAWSENGTDWKSPWLKPGGDFDTTVIGDFYAYMDNNNIWFDWDVDDFVFDMVNGRVENHGFILLVTGGYGLQFSLNQENYFHSSEYSVPNLRPKLTVTYSDNTAVQENVSVLYERFFIRQSGKSLQLYIPGTGRSSVTIIDSEGRTIRRTVVNRGDSNNTLDLGGFSSGVYFVSVVTGNGIMTKKIYIQQNKIPVGFQ